MQTDKNLFGKVREVVSRHGQKRKEMDLVPRKGEDRKTDDRFYRQQSIVKKVMEAVANVAGNIPNTPKKMSLKQLDKHISSVEKEQSGDEGVSSSDRAYLNNLRKIRAKHPELKKEEVEQVDELSKDTLKSYMSKAGDTTNAKGEGARKSFNRLIGMGRASKKLKNEDINTSFKDFIK